MLGSALSLPDKMLNHSDPNTKTLINLLMGNNMIKKIIQCTFLVIFSGCINNLNHGKIKGPLKDLYDIQDTYFANINKLSRESDAAKIKLDTLKMERLNAEINIIKKDEVEKIKRFISNKKINFPFEQNIKKDIYQINEIYVSDVTYHDISPEMDVILTIKVTKGIKCNKFKIMRLEYLDTDNDKIRSDYFDMNDTVFTSRVSLTNTFCNFEKINIL